MYVLLLDIISMFLSVCILKRAASSWNSNEQGFDDHAHPPTLRELVKKLPDIPVIAPPSAKPILEAMPQQFSNVTFVSHFDKIDLPSSSAEKVQLMVTPGARLGPPWVTKENGYIITAQNGCSMYYGMLRRANCLFSSSSSSSSSSSPGY